MGVRAAQVLKNFFISFLVNDDGQGTVEYILLLSATSLGALVLGRGIVGTLDKAVLVFGAVLEEDLKTGRAPAYVWTN